jgi:hypothetical protein
MPDNIFQYQKPTELQLEVMMELRAHCDEHHRMIMQSLPPGRCRSLAITKLEEVSMWENKACVFELGKEVE